MDLHKALHQRRTIHIYKPEPIPDEAVQRALQAAIMAPNHRLTWPWRFTQVGGETRARLAELAVRLKTRAGTELSEAKIEKIRAKVQDPAELVVVSLIRQSDPSIAREDYASAACAIQNLQLSLCAEDIGSKWSSGELTNDAETYRILAIDALSEEIIAFVWAGIAEKIPNTPQRPPLQQLLRQRP